MKTINASPRYKLAVRLAPTGGEIMAAPGPLANFLYQLSQDNNPIRSLWVEGQYLNVIPYTAALDAALTGLVDDLIDLRYATGQVQLELFSLKGE